MLMTKLFLHKNAFFSTLISPIDPASDPYHATRLSACFHTASFSLGWVGPEKWRRFHSHTHYNELSWCRTDIIIKHLAPGMTSLVVVRSSCDFCSKSQVVHMFMQPCRLLKWFSRPKYSGQRRSIFCELDAFMMFCPARTSWCRAFMRAEQYKERIWLSPQSFGVMDTSWRCSHPPCTR